MEGRQFHFSVPWITIYIAILVPLLTNIYLALPARLQGGAILWLTSPFNIAYEMGGSGLLLNYGLLVLIYLLVELYSRNIADLKGRVSLIRNAALISILSSYIVSGLVWANTGMPSSGTSILAFNVLIFFSFETYDSELIRRMSEERANFRKVLELASIAFVILVTALSTTLFVYINGNMFWYIHILGGIIFAPLYYIYLLRYVRPRVDELEEKAEARIEKDLEKTGIEIEEEVEKVEDDIKKDLKKGKKKGKQPHAS